MLLNLLRLLKIGFCHRLQTLSFSSKYFGPKVFVKLQDNKYSLWNRQVEGVILTHDFIDMFNTDENRLNNAISDKCKTWIIQDQTLFIWVLSTISVSLLPQILMSKRSYEVWDRVHKPFTTIMKVLVGQLLELKTVKLRNLIARPLSMLFELKSLLTLCDQMVI